jgi:hypothetical protein
VEYLYIKVPFFYSAATSAASVSRPFSLRSKIKKKLSRKKKGGGGTLPVGILNEYLSHDDYFH